MPSILSRFKRSPSTSSAKLSDDDPSSPSSRHRRPSTASSLPRTVSTSDDEGASSSRATSTASPQVVSSGSHFLEELDDPAGTPASVEKNKRYQSGDTITPANGSKHRPSPLGIPDSAQKPLIGTPKLVLTEEGSNSPRSFSSSPNHNRSSGDFKEQGYQASGLGLGLGEPLARAPSNSSKTTVEDDLPTARTADHSFSVQQSRTTVMSGPVPTPPSTTHLDSAAPSRSRSGSLLSAKGGRQSRSGSLINRSPQLHPTLSSDLPTLSKKEKKERKKRRRERGMSASSGRSGHMSIAAALGKAAMPGLHIASPTDQDGLSSSHSMTSAHSKRASGNRSPWLVRGGGGDDQSFARTEEGDDDEDEDDDDDDDDDSDLDEHLPVTGFAVASNRRNAEFHGMFPAVDEGDYLIEDYGCALSKDILVQGRLYVSENHLCFHANIFGWVTDLVIPFAGIKVIEKKMTALVIPNAIGVYTQKGEKYTFASFISRDTTFDVLMNIWRLCNPNAVMSTVSFQQHGSRPASIVDGHHDEATVVDAGGSATGGSGGGKGHAKTECACGKKGDHYSETALDTTFATTPEKAYNLMFTSGWYKNFLSETEKLREIEQSDWKPISASNTLLTRTMSYIKPLNGSIGPKQTKCHIVDEQDHCEFEDYISMITTTKTPDVPSGGVFSVKTRTCLTWAGGRVGTRVLVTTTVEWTGKSWVKGIIEKSAIDGQKTYHDDLATGMKQHIKDHPTEFAVPGFENDSSEPDADIVAADTSKGGVATQGQTEAEAYAAKEKAKRDRQEKDYTYLSAAMDAVTGGGKMIFGGIFEGGKAIGDLLGLKEGEWGRKELFLIMLVFGLVVSNLWTWVTYRSEGSRDARLARRAGRGREGDLEEAVKKLLYKQGLIARDPGTGMKGAKGEVGELTRLLDEVERRAGRLREELASAIGGERLD